MRAFMKNSVTVVAVLVLTALPSPGRAGNAKPYQGAFNFAVLEAVPTPVPGVILVTGSLDGNETHLGRFTGEVQYHVNTGTGMFYGTLFKVAANGDKLYESLTGQFTATGSFGDFTMTGGTGRFANVIGGGTFIGKWIVYPSTAVVGYEGTISYDASDRRP